MHAFWFRPLDFSLSSGKKKVSCLVFLKSRHFSILFFVSILFTTCRFAFTQVVLLYIVLFSDWFTENQMRLMNCRNLMVKSLKEGLIIFFFFHAIIHDKFTQTPERLYHVNKAGWNILNPLRKKYIRKSDKRLLLFHSFVLGIWIGYLGNKLIIKKRLYCYTDRHQLEQNSFKNL